MRQGQKLDEHMAGAGVDAPPDRDQYFLPLNNCIVAR